MVFRDCHVTFHSAPNAVFYGGQVVAGKIEFNLEKSKSVRGVYFEIKGCAKVSWKERHGKKTRHFRGKEEYFKSRTVLVHRGDETFDLQPGFHSYDFSFLLPAQLPTSFESDNGTVRYTTEVILDRPWKFDQKHKVAFTVLANVDLNLNLEYREPVRIQEVKEFSMLFFSNGSLRVDAHIPIRAYVPGQKIPVKLAFINESTIEIEAIKTQLRQLSFLSATSPVKKTRKYNVLLNEVVSEGIKPNSKRTLDVVLVVPPLPPSTLKLCSVIDVTYDVKVTCVTSMFHKDCRVKLPIVIGTVPLMAFPTDYNTFPSSSNQQSNVETPPSPSAPPPSYEECMRQKASMTDDEDDQFTKHSIKNFAPKYVTYNYDQHK